MPTPLSIVQAQLDAYNARDIDAFAATFAEDVQGFDLVNEKSELNAQRFQGIAALRARYGPQFREHPRQRSTVVTRNVLGDVVYDLEYITGTQGRPDFFLMATYWVRESRIAACWFSPRVTPT
jgi:hypothetical protein